MATLVGGTSRFVALLPLNGRDALTVGAVVAAVGLQVSTAARLTTCTIFVPIKICAMLRLPI